MCGWGGLLTLQMRNMWSGQGLASSLDHPALDILEFWSTGNESPVTLPCGVGSVYLLPQEGRVQGSEEARSSRSMEVKCVCVCVRRRLFRS